jgi:hypothetical protein
MVKLWFDLAKDALHISNQQQNVISEHHRAYLVLSSGAVAICRNVPFNGMVGWETMYAAMPTCTLVDTTSSAAQRPAAMVTGSGGNLWFCEQDGPRDERLGVNIHKQRTRHVSGCGKRTIEVYLVA